MNPINRGLQILQASLVRWPTVLAFCKDAQLSQRDRAAGCVSFGQNWNRN